MEGHSWSKTFIFQAIQLSEKALIQTIQFCINIQFSSISPIDRALSDTTWVDLGTMAMKRYSAFPKAPTSLEPHHQIVWCHIQNTLRGVVLPLGRGAVGVFYSLSRLGKRESWDVFICFLRALSRSEKQIASFIHRIQVAVSFFLIRKMLHPTSLPLPKSFDYEWGAILFTNQWFYKKNIIKTKYCSVCMVIWFHVKRKWTTILFLGWIGWNIYIHTYIHTYIYITNLHEWIRVSRITLFIRLWASWPCSTSKPNIRCRVIPKTQKMVVDAALLNTQHLQRKDQR